MTLLITPREQREVSKLDSLPSVSRVCQWVQTSADDLEIVHVGRGRYLAYSQQHHYSARKPVNDRATSILHRAHHVNLNVHGNAVLFTENANDVALRSR